MIGDVSGMGVLVCSNELSKGARNVGYRNKVVVLVVLVCDTKTSTTIAASASWRSFFPLAIHSHAQSISPASCRSKRVDDHSRFYANFRDFRGARVSTLESMTIRTNVEIWSPKKT